ncbi:TetR/AcrR family transcriptional regulator [Ferrimonas pelagia]|uniref:HTH tetR-type domain-containing protein n=1 Tax=Ferrimonas pelagia TaxID=1177826 RepID=A0ABP9FE17_9GAMM
MGEQASRVALTRERIIDTGLEMAAQGPIAQISMHKLAARLSVTPMAIYKHFANKAELQAYLLDGFIAHAVVIPDAGLDWPVYLEQLARNMYQALSAQPDWAELFGHVRMLPGLQAVMESCVAKLLSAGFDADRALPVYYGLTQCVLGAVTQNRHLQAQSGKTSSQAVSEQTYPLLAQLLPGVGKSVYRDPLSCCLIPFIDGLRR